MLGQKGDNISVAMVLHYFSGGAWLAVPIGQTVSLGRQLFFKCMPVLVQTDGKLLTRRAMETSSTSSAWAEGLPW